MATMNPYAAPKAAIDAPIHDLRVDFYEEDGCLVVRTDSRLPPLCVGTGEPAEDDLKTRTIRHVPTYTIWLFIFLSPVIGLILMLALQKRYRLTFAVSERARARRRMGLLFGFGVLLAALCVGYISAVIDSGMLLLAAIFGVWAGIFLMFTKGRPYRVRKASGAYVYLQLHADALYEFERYRQQHLAPPAPAGPRQSSPHSPF